MDTRTLKHFLILADTLHFSRASESCNISPSALSRNIKQLEEELGVSLFLRDNRSVQLTPEGQKFRVYARETLSQWDAMRGNLLENVEQLQGEISMYCSVTASYSVLYDLLNRFRRHYPGIELKLHTGDPEHAIGRIMAGNEDITIAARPDSLPKGLVFKPVTISPLLFIAPTQPDFELPHSSKPWPATPMILSESGVARKRVDAWFRGQNIKPRVYAQVTGNEAIVSMVSLGFGVGVVPKIVLDNSPMTPRVQILDVQPELEPYDVGLCTLEKKLKSPLVHAFWSLHNRE